VAEQLIADLPLTGAAPARLGFAHMKLTSEDSGVCEWGHLVQCRVRVLACALECPHGPFVSCLVPEQTQPYAPVHFKAWGCSRD